MTFQRNGFLYVKFVWKNLNLITLIIDMEALGKNKL